MLRADAENRRKEGDEVYILDKESIEAIKDELSDDFISLADEQRVAVRQLVAQLDDDQLDNQLRFEKYERERRRQEVAKKTAAISISDEEPSSEQTPVKAGGSQPDSTQEEPLKEGHPQEPVHAGQQNQETPRPVEPEKEEEPVRPVEPEMETELVRPTEPQATDANQQQP